MGTCRKGGQGWAGRGGGDAAGDGGGLRAGVLDGAAAVEALGLFGEVERLGAAGMALAAGRVEATRAWQGSGNRSAAHFVADAVGLRCARRWWRWRRPGGWKPAGHRRGAALGEAVDGQGQRDRLHGRRPAGEEAELVAAAEVRDTAGVAGALPGGAGRGDGRVEGYEKVRESRYLRHWSDGEGAFRLEARLCPDEGAKVLAAWSPTSGGSSPTPDVTGGGSPTRPTPPTPWWRWPRGDGEAGPRRWCTCGSTTPRWSGATSRRARRATSPGWGHPGGHGPGLAADGILKVLVTKGVDVVAVAHGGRTIPAHVRSALVARDPKCVVPGCDVRDRLEIDHLVPFAEGGPTTLDNLARLCRRHHMLKTHQGWVLAGRPGAWMWDRPDEPPP